MFKKKLLFIHIKIYYMVRDFRPGEKYVEKPQNLLNPLVLVFLSDIQ